MSLPQVGEIVTARVKTITQYGAWIAWDECEALVLIPDVSGGPPIRHPGDVLKLGQEVRAVVVVVTMDTPPRIRASIKDVTP